jgi:phage gp36-like protein
MAGYVDIEYVKLVGSMPAADVDQLDTLYAGTVAGVSEAVSRMFDARLAKRYAAPFATPYPEALKWHVAQVVVYTLWQKRGFNPSSEMDSLITKNRDEALAWLKEAADAKDGLIELPLRQDTTAEGVSKGAPLSYHEQSPYKWTDLQAEEARFEDQR